jgi:hypothetical protein
MSIFSEANQARLALKMKLSQYGWYKSSSVESTEDGFGVIINVTHIDNNIRKIIPPVFGGVYVKTEADT